MELSGWNLGSEYNIGEHSAILLTSIKLPFVFKTFVLAIFECPLKTGFTVLSPANYLMISRNG